MISELSIIHPSAKIGDNVTIEPFVSIGENVEIGDNCIIMSGAKVVKNTKMGRNNKIYHSAVIGGDPQDLKFKGEETTLEIGDNNMFREFTTINRGTASRQKTVIGSNCLIMAYCHVIVQGGALVNKDIPPYIMAARFPITYTGVNSVGLNRRGFTEKQIDDIKNMYRILFHSDMIVSQAIEKIETEYESSEIRNEILNFIKMSDRGILKGNDCSTKH